MNKQNEIRVMAQMLIRRPVTEVFEAFVNPEITTKFWFTKSTGKLEQGKRIRWDWEMYGVGTDLIVKEIEPNKKILIEWDEPACPVKWKFEPTNEHATMVSISNWGFHGSHNEIVDQAIDSKGGFSIVLAGAKALLEYGIELNLVGDQHPKSKS